MNDFKNLKVIVKRILERDVNFADDDKKLCWIVWRECMNMPINTPLQLTWTVYKNLPLESTITRARRQIEQLYPHLRGKTWEQRQNKQAEVQEILQDAKYQFQK